MIWGICLIMENTGWMRLLGWKETSRMEFKQAAHKTTREFKASGWLKKTSSFANPLNPLSGVGDAFPPSDLILSVPSSYSSSWNVLFPLFLRQPDSSSAPTSTPHLCCSIKSSVGRHLTTTPCNRKSGWGCHRTRAGASATFIINFSPKKSF